MTVRPARALIYTDAFGMVTAEQHRVYRAANVSPSDHTALVEKFGRDDPDGAIEFVKAHTVNGMYRPPWPFPYGGS